MLHLIQSNKMEALEAQLIDLISDPSRRSNPLQAQTILVQSPGMAQWLKIEVARHLGIAANLDFPLPSSYIWQLYRRYFDDLPEQSAFNKNSMAWKLMAILPELLNQPGYEQLSMYLESSDEYKRFGLCQKIADVYDQYLMYRPDWLLAWEQGEDEPDGCVLNQHVWQPSLWRQLVAQTELLGESPHHRANLHLQLLQRIADDQSLKASQPLYIFGLSAIPKQQLEVFSALGQHQQVYIFWCNPSQEYWGDVVDETQKARLSLLNQELGDTAIDDYFDVGNPLLSSWGKLGRDYLEMLLKLEVEQHDLFVDLPAESLLTHMQSEILHLTMRASSEPLSPEELLTDGMEYPKIPIRSDDTSLTIHSCHSKTRELEVLHDFLLAAFEQDPQLTPGEIIVMIPDVAQYAPYIDGVFGGADSKRYIPYAISDRNAAQESPIIESFLQLLSLHQSRLGLSEILSILEVPAVQVTFELSQAELDIIRFWLHDAGVKWGWNAEDKKRWQVPEENQNTWIFGLNRLLSGYALEGTALCSIDGQRISPYRDIEGQQAVALGKLYRFSHELLKVIEHCHQTQPIAQKVAEALDILECFYQVDDSDQVYLNQLRQTLEEVEKHHLHYQEPISQDIFVAQVQQGVQEKGVGQRFLAGFVNFCTLMPMRSIPFKRVCILGMNDGDYPRQSVPIGFDIMRHSPAIQGDRSRKLDDRYLFLEAILCARQQLYLSYQGLSGKDNSERNPSVLISELLDYCKFTYRLEQNSVASSDQAKEPLLAKLVTQHPLQPFSSRYFDPQFPHVSSFVEHWLSVSRQQGQPIINSGFLEQALTALEVQDHEVEIEALNNAWGNPAKWLFNQRWRTNLRLYFDTSDEHEPFHLEPIDRYQFVDKWLRHSLSQSQQDSTLVPDVIEQLMAQGALPLGAKAALVAEQVHSLGQQILSSIESLAQGHPRSKVEVDLSLQQYRLVGWVDGVYKDRLILYRSGKLRGKDKLQLWINWLALSATGRYQDGNASFVCQDKTYGLSAIEPDQARRHLLALLDGYQMMISQPIHCFPDAAFAWTATSDLAKTLSAFQGREGRGEASEPHIARVCPDLESVFDEFTQHCESIYQPIIAHEEKR